MSVSSPVIVPAKTMRTTRPREIDHRVSSVFIDPRSEYIGNETSFSHEEEFTLSLSLSLRRE